MTTIDLVDGLIRYSMAVLAPIAGATVWFYTFQGNRTERYKAKVAADLSAKKMDMDREVALAKENSAGAAAITQLIAKDAEIIKEMHEIEERFEDRDNETRGQLQNITQQIQQFTLQAINLLTGSSKNRQP